MDRTKYQYEGMKWIVELELLNNPQVINTLKMNILMVSKRIKEVELLIYRENRSMLVLLDLTWIGRTFFLKQISMEVQDILTQLLPSFRFRVTQDPKIMEMAVNLVKQALTGGQNENVSNPSDVSSKLTSEQLPVPSTSPGESPGNEDGNETDQKEQPIYPDAILPYVGSGDSSQE